MSIIADNLKPEIQSYFQGLDRPVTVDFYPQANSPATDPMRQLLEELHDLAPLIQPISHAESAQPQGVHGADDVEGPVVTLSVEGHFSGIRYLGFPGGHEFGTLLADLKDLSSGAPVDLSPETENWLKNLSTPLHLEVFVTPT